MEIPPRTTGSSSPHHSSTGAPEPATFLATGPPTHWHPEIASFRDYIHHGLGGHAHKGVNGRGEEVTFVCREALERYWERDKIKNVLERDRNNEAHAEVIETTCLETFSILCYINCSHYFNHFTSTLRLSDSLLPIVPPSYSDGPWSSDVGLRDALARFRQEQWKFKPLVFNTAIHRKELTADYILPVVYDQPALADHGESAVYKVSVQPCCVAPRFESFANSQDVVFKMLSSDESVLWENEVDAYNFLARRSPDGAQVGKALVKMLPSANRASSFNYIARCLGSFRRMPTPDSRSNQHGLGPADLDAIKRDTIEKTHVIVLEYARGGNLATFCQDYNQLVVSPNREDRLNFWHQMFHLLQALSAVHSIDGTHQDIKESNILYMYENGSLVDRETACFKLADFGKSHFKRPGGTESEARDTNKFGNRIYRAPECCGADEVEQTSPRSYTKTADIWSLGCLFSNMLVRSSLGQKGVDRYQEARAAANQHTIMRDYAPQCFHDGVNPLGCVKEFHDEALKKYPEDDVLRAVSDTILNKMLQPRGAREADALTIRGDWLNHINASNNNMGRVVTADTSSPASPAAPSSQPGPVIPRPSRASTGASTMPPPPPGSFRQTTLPPAALPRTSTAASNASAGTRRAVITVQQIADHLRRPQRSWPSFLRSGEDLTTIFPGLLSPLNAMGQRNHHFLVDSSETMAQFQQDAVETIWVLAKLLKPRVARRGNVTLSILANPNKVHSLNTSTEFADLVRNSEFSDSTAWLLGLWLQRIATEVINGLANKPSPPISLYILTDGDFGETSPDFASPIGELLQRLRDRQSIMPSFLSVTIIQFGDGVEAHQALRLIQQSLSSLDAFPSAFNPIRICPWNGDVAEMLVGRIRDSTTNLSLVGMIRRNTSGIPTG